MAKCKKCNKDFKAEKITAWGIDIITVNCPKCRGINAKVTKFIKDQKNN